MDDTFKNKEKAIEDSSSSEIDKSEVTSDSSEPQAEQLSRHERKKLKKQQWKEEYNAEQNKGKGKKMVKTVIFSIIGLVVVAGIIFMFINGGKTNYPNPDTDPFLGLSDAPLTIVEFGDYQCPFTRSFNTGPFKELMEEYDGQIKWVFKDMVTGRHVFSDAASMAAECANDQGKYWEYHDLLFERFAADETSLKSYAAQLELNMDEFNSCLDSKKYKNEIKEDYLEGKKAGVTITPTFYIYDNEKLEVTKLQGDLKASVFRPIIDNILGEV